MSFLAAAAPATAAASAAPAAGAATQGAGVMGMMDALKKDSDMYGKMPLPQLTADVPQMPMIQAATGGGQPFNSAAAYHARNKGFGV